MLDFLFMVLIVGGLALLGWGLFEAFGRIAAHMRGNPEAANAIVQHVFLPLFGGKTEPERKLPTSSAMVVSKSPSEPTGSN